MSKCFEVRTLPDIEIYGGDTTPWEITLIKDDGTPIKADTSGDYTATLTLTPLKATVGLGRGAVTDLPIPDGFPKEGTQTETTDGYAAIEFTFGEADTINLRGKYLYQVDVRHGDQRRVGQGTLYVKHNINR